MQKVHGGGGGDFAPPSQIRGGKFRGAPWILCGTPRQSPQCVLLVCEKFARNPEFHVGNFAVNYVASSSWPVVGHEILNGDVGGGFQGVQITSGFFQIWRAAGITNNVHLHGTAVIII